MLDNQQQKVPIHVTQMMVSRQAETIPDTTTIHQLVPGFKINNQSTYKLNGSSGRKCRDKSRSITKFKRQPSFSLNSTISKINLSPRPTKPFKQKKYAETSHTFRRNTPRRTFVLQSINQDYSHKPTYWNIDRWDTYDDRNDSKSFIF
ncbi:unnamed protein product (macronuclear) [Paramecium tetraurelia]|uniref:Uncharacterized protein n=1 Tax=Paramecium tetraurelia TaxID=5888 RepID=A0C5D0_PARTE|nr:uncharacterized protein GSPATT00006496001 [Paramecium tetraurelia]CAK65997.1 unnamed protein product [Paramecium tetraurelia]|eukprot:XP_001433394.1 hypothetical protein (macronuclear) [Paramecium tetraurelia strain d4-2]